VLCDEALGAGAAGTAGPEIVAPRTPGETSGALVLDVAADGVDVDEASAGGVEGFAADDGIAAGGAPAVIRLE
jgi:hypothetical protein